MNILLQIITGTLIISLMVWVAHLQTRLNISNCNLEYWKSQALRINKANKLYKQIIAEMKNENR